MAVEFTPSAGPTVGIEWEIGLVDAESMDLVPAAEVVFDALRDDNGDLDPHIHPELQRNTVELVTGVCDTVGQAIEELKGALAAVHSVTDPLGIEVFSAGSHPFAHSHEQETTPDERYDLLLDRTQYWGRQMLIYGVHVHVGIDSSAKAMPLINGLLPYNPHLLALSASSPFWGGVDTGYASHRSLIFQQLPTAGLPFHFDTWQEYERYVDDLFTTGVITVLKEVRWDIRPSPGFGTIENRICDGVSSIAEMEALGALTHCLVIDLSDRLDAGESLPNLPPWHAQENKWRAARYGLEAEIILDAANSERLVTDDVMDLLERLDPVARRLGCASELASVETIIRQGAGYQRQRRVFADSDDPRAVVADLVAQLKKSLL